MDIKKLKIQDDLVSDLHHRLIHVWTLRLGNILFIGMKVNYM